MEERRSPVERLMTVGVLTVGTETAVVDAARTLLSEDVGSLVVVDESDTPVGMFTNTDLSEFVSEESPADATVSQYMTNTVVSIGDGSGLDEAAAKMIRHGIHHLPVTDEEGGIVGMLSTMDLTSHFSYTGGTDVV